VALNGPWKFTVGDSNDWPCPSFLRSVMHSGVVPCGPDLVRQVPHVAFEVDDLDAELLGAKF
jgi:hypothetical protein